MEAPPFVTRLGAALALAMIVTLALASAKEPPAKAAPLFDGKSFAGWDGDTKKNWRIEDGTLAKKPLAA